MVDTDAVERCLLGPGLELRFGGVWLSWERSRSRGWNGEGEVGSRVSVSNSPVPFLRPVPGRDLVRLGVGVPGTSNTIVLRKSSDSSRGDVKVGGLAGRIDVSTILALSLART